MKATIKRDRDLKGATPETLARALLRPRLRGKPVVSQSISCGAGCDRQVGRQCFSFEQEYLNCGCCACQQTLEHIDQDALG